MCMYVYFQAVPEASPALQMLDMLGLPRLQVYRTLFTDLRAKLEGNGCVCAKISSVMTLVIDRFVRSTSTQSASKDVPMSNSSRNYCHHPLSILLSQSSDPSQKESLQSSKKSPQDFWISLWPSPRSYQSCLYVSDSRLVVKKVQGMTNILPACFYYLMPLIHTYHRLGSYIPISFVRRSPHLLINIFKIGLQWYYQLWIGQPIPKVLAHKKGEMTIRRFLSWLLTLIRMNLSWSQ